MFWISFGPQVSRYPALLRGILLVMVGLGGLAGCGEGHETDCLKSTGKVLTQRRELAPFTIVEANDNVDVILVQDTATYAEVRAGQHLQADIELTVQAGQLTIHNTSRCNWVRTYDTPRQVTLHLPLLTDLYLKGQGNVRTAGRFQGDAIFCHLVGAGDFDLDFDCRYLWADMYELGDVTLHGQAQELHLTVGGSGRLRGLGLATQTIYFTSNASSRGNAYLRAATLLTGTHAGHGTLYYTGLPAHTDAAITGKGKVVRQ